MKLRIKLARVLVW